MGRGSSYTIQDYADRIEVYLNNNGGGAFTEDIMTEVRGTNYRLLDGLVLLLQMGVIEFTEHNHRFKWSLTTEDRE